MIAGPNRAVLANGEFFSFEARSSACSRIFMLVSSTTEVPRRAVLSPTSSLLFSATISLLLLVDSRALLRGVFSDGAVAWRMRACTTTVAFDRFACAEVDDAVEIFDLAVDSRLGSLFIGSCEDSFVIGRECIGRVCVIF